ncbi:hypothetical protein MKW94_012418 [Papaver nudicaule]|uniref:Tubulin alpha-6 chain n=1 Tax=Papaver nudicaule TaxID=74823 RepID=A0AA42AZZ5_PAPNU|nr:hypothetical protein [Papaver nudicaule]
MASLQIGKSNFSPFLGFRSDLQSTLFMMESDFIPLKLRSHKKLKFPVRREFRVCCRVQNDDGETNKGEEPTESLFMKELRRRGMKPTSLIEESAKKSLYEAVEETTQKEDERGFLKSSVSTDFEIGRLANQRQTSMALNSEGLEGLIPRAKLLLTLGATFFLGFWPLILGTVVIFGGLYFYFGPSFIHDATMRSSSPPPYIDPYVLLEEDRLSKIAQNVK